MTILRVLGLLALLVVPGWLAVSLLKGRDESLDGGERIFLVFVMGTGIVSLAAFSLALASVYNLINLMILTGFACLAMFFPARGRMAWTRRLKATDIFAALAVIAVALILFSPPGRTVFGWSDVGVYPNVAAHIEREGGVVMEVETVREISPERRDLVYYTDDRSIASYEALENKNYFITDFDTGEVISRFYFLWPSTMAVFASILGLESMFWAVTAAAVLAFWGLFLLSRRLLGWRWGMAVVLIAGLSPLMVYFTRYTTSEMMNMALFVSTLLSFVAYHRANKKEDESGAQGLAVIAAFLLTLGFLCRIDFLLILLPLSLCYLVRKIFIGLSSSDKWFISLTLSGAILSMIIGLVYSGPYFNAVWGSITRFLVLVIVPIVAIMIISLLSPFYSKALNRVVGYLGKVGNLLSVLVWLALTAAFIFLYFIRPLGTDSLINYGLVNPIQGSSFAGQTMVRWAWYFPFIGLVLAFAGYALWFTRRRDFAGIVMAALGITFTLFYGWNMRCTPIHILTMRRLVPVILPLALIMIVYALGRLIRCTAKLIGGYRVGVWAGRFAVGGILLFLALYAANVSIPIFGLQEGGNQLEVTEKISQIVEENAVVILDYHLGDLFGPPLRSFFGVENAWLLDNRSLEEKEFLGLLSDLGFPDRPVYLLWRRAMSGEHITHNPAFELNLVYEMNSHEEVLEKSFEHRPEQREMLNDEYLLLQLQADEPIMEQSDS